MSNLEGKVEISWKAIIKFFIVLGAILFLYLIRDVLVLFFIVIVIVAALIPIVDRWSKFLPRWLAVLSLYLAILVVLTGLGFLIIPPIVRQTSELASTLPDWFSKVLPILKPTESFISLSQQILSAVSQSLAKIGGEIYATTKSFLNGIIAIITIFVLTFYLLLGKGAIRDFLLSHLPIDQKEEIVEILRKIGLKMGNWLRGQLSLMALVGLLDLIGLVILGIPYALTLAVWAALTEIIPYIGPWLGLIPALIIGFFTSPLKALLIFIWYIVVQQIEAQILIPKIMGKAVGLSPVIIIFAILVGAKLGGILGIVLAVPAAAALSVLAQEWPKLRLRKE